MSKTNTPLTSAMIAEWVVKYRHQDSDPEMLFRIIRNVDQLVVQEMQAAREDERARMREVIMLYRTDYGDIITYLLNKLK